MIPVEPIAKYLPANVKLVAPGCGDLPAYHDKEQGYYITRWKMNFRERLQVLLRGSVYLWVHGDAHPPVSVEASIQAE